MKFRKPVIVTPCWFRRFSYLPVEGWEKLVETGTNAIHYVGPKEEGLVIKTGKANNTLLDSMLAPVSGLRLWSFKEMPESGRVTFYA